MVATLIGQTGLSANGRLAGLADAITPVTGNGPAQRPTGADALLSAASPLQNLLGGTLAAATTHVVKAGETLSAIAQDHATSVQSLVRLNGLVDPGRLGIGQVLRIPEAVAGAVVRATVPVLETAGEAVRDVATAAMSPKGLDVLFEREAVKGVTDRLHWLRDDGGARLGAGYDMKGRAAGEVVRDLVAIGIDRSVAAEVARGAGLQGATARDFVAAHADALRLTPAQERALLANVIAGYAAHVRAAVTVPLTQGQFDALVSFAYALGQSGFDGSMVLQKLNAGDLAGAAEAMALWARSDGQQGLQGLVNRRVEEIQLFNMPGGPLASREDDAVPARSAGNARTDPAAVANTPADYARIVERHGDAQARSDLDAGRRVVVALRTPMPTEARGGQGGYDDRIAVVWKQPDGTFRAETFAGDTEPGGRSGLDARAAAVDPDRLPAGTIRYRQQADQYFGNTYFRGGPTPAAERGAGDALRIDAGGGDRSERSDAGTGLLLHQGGVTNTYSAGCQMLARDQYNGFVRALCGQQAFSYVLVDALGARDTSRLVG